MALWEILQPAEAVSQLQFKIPGARRVRGARDKPFRLQAGPFWSVGMVRSQRSETGARRNKRDETVSLLFLQCADAKQT